MPAETLLEVRDLTVSYGRGAHARTALDAASFTLGGGETVGIIGESGSGKTTLARTVLGLVKPRRGSVHVAGRELTSFSAREWSDFRRQGVVQYVFQDPLRSLDPDLTVAESIAEPLRIQGKASDSEIEARTLEQLRRLSLEPVLLPRFPAELSGGQRQRVSLARALISDPRVLILDEPVSALDAANRVRVLESLRELRTAGMSLLFISHDLGSVAGICDRVLVLYRGAIVEQASTAEIITRPRHPYTKLLVGAAPTLTRGAVSREQRHALRRELDSWQRETDVHDDGHAAP